MGLSSAGPLTCEDVFLLNLLSSNPSCLRVNWRLGIGVFGGQTYIKHGFLTVWVVGTANPRTV